MHPWSKSILWPRAQSIFIRLRVAYNFIHFKLLLLRILFFRDKLTSVDGHVGLNNRSPFFEWSISVALLLFKDGLVLTDTFSVNVWRMLIFLLCGFASTVSSLFGEKVLNLFLSSHLQKRGYLKNSLLYLLLLLLKKIFNDTKISLCFKNYEKIFVAFSINSPDILVRKRQTDNPQKNGQKTWKGTSQKKKVKWPINVQFTGIKVMQIKTTRREKVHSHQLRKNWSLIIISVSVGVIEPWNTYTSGGNVRHYLGKWFCIN